MGNDLVKKKIGTGTGTETETKRKTENGKRKTHFRILLSRLAVVLGHYASVAMLSTKLPPH